MRFTWERTNHHIRLLSLSQFESEGRWPTWNSYSLLDLTIWMNDRRMFVAVRLGQMYYYYIYVCSSPLIHYTNECEGWRPWKQNASSVFHRWCGQKKNKQHHMPSCQKRRKNSAANAISRGRHTRFLNAPSKYYVASLNSSKPGELYGAVRI